MKPKVEDIFTEVQEEKRLKMEVKRLKTLLKESEEKVQALSDHVRKAEAKAKLYKDMWNRSNTGTW